MAKISHGIALRHLNTLLNVGAVGGLTDAQLLELFTTGRDETAELAFTVLVDRHGPMVLRVCQAVLRDSHDAQDAFQATFLVLVKKARGLWVRETLGPWLHQVALRVASCARAAMARRRRHERQAAWSSAEIAGEAIADDLGQILHEEVNRLPERYRAAVVLCLLEGLTTEQAARQLGWPVGTIHSRLARGRERLRRRLIRQGLGPGVAGAGLLVAAETPAATVPSALVAATGRAATRFLAGAVVDGMVSSSVAALTKGALKTKMMTKLTMVAGATLAIGVAVTSAGMLGEKRRERDDTSTPPNQQKVQSESSPASGPIAHPARETPADGAEQENIQAKPSQPMRDVMIKRVRDGDALALAISPDGKTLAAGCTDSSVQLLDARTGERRIALAGKIRGYARVLAFTPDGKTIAGVCDDQRLHLWDAGSGQLMKELPALGDMEKAGPRHHLNSLAISRDGSLVAVGGSGQTNKGATDYRDERTFFEVRVLNEKTGELIWSHFGRRGSMMQLAFSPDCKTLASATYGEVRLWDARAGDLRQTLKPSSGTIWALAFSPDNRFLAGYGNASVDEQNVCLLTIWDMRTGAIVHSINACPAFAVAVAGTIAFSPDSKTVASAGCGTMVGLISFGGRLHRGSKVVSYVKLWDVATGALVWTSAEGDLGHVNSLMFSPDGASIYCCDSSGTTRIDAKTGQTRQDLMKATDGAQK